jgi:hypothetical protein
VPYESRLFVKTGAVYLVLTFAAGAALLIASALKHPAPFIVTVEHGHLGFVGWLVNMVIGVALWMFPLDRERYPQMQGRYPAGAPFVCYALLNIGLVARIVIEPWGQLTRAPGPWPWLLVAAGLMQFLAIILFVMIVWHRTRGPKQPAPGIR